MAHTPQRMCAVCRGRFAKAQLLRHVRGADGALTPDAQQRLPGRGIYVCTRDECRQRFVGICNKQHKHARKALAPA